MGNKILTKKEFAHLIPHRGNMIFIDGVENWDLSSIHCSSHLDCKTPHPLQNGGMLSSQSLLEYGAQAIAVHAGLVSGSCQLGFLAAIRDARFFIDYLEPSLEYLSIHASVELKLNNGAIYAIQINDSKHNTLVLARITVINVVC